MSTRVDSGINDWCTPRYSDSPQSGRRVADFSWIGLRAALIGKTPNQIPKIRGLLILSPKLGLAFQHFGTKVWKARPNMHGAQIASVPRSMLCFWCMQHLDPLQYFSSFYCFYICLSVLKMYWVIVTADCRNSVCRNRVCRNSVCLPNSSVVLLTRLILSLE